jgi:hypothetical protein
MYCEGMICNLEIAKKIFQDWIIYVYYDDTVPKEYLEKISSYDNCKMIDMNGNDIYKKCWRFLALDDDIDIMLSRDSDSRLSYREKILVEEFENSNKKFHDVRDNRQNHAHVMGGMWGAKKGLFDQSIKKLITDRDIDPSKLWGWDQFLMIDLVDGYVDKNDILKHDIKFSDFPKFPTERMTHPIDSNDRTYHIGEVFPTHNYHKPLDNIFF